MSILQTITRSVPPGVVARLGRLQYQVPLLRPLIQHVARPMRRGPSTIRHGIGAGLSFDPHGGNPGFALGTSGEAEQEVLARYLSTGGVFYDIGANKGFYAVIGAHLLGPGGHVYAFEPFPESARAVEANARLNGHAQITVIEAAVSDRTSEEELLVAGDSVEFKLAGSLNAKRDGVFPSIRVKVYAIDDLVRRGALRPPTFVLIDVEGSEVDVLWGMRKTIAAHRPVILCEVHWIRREFLEVVEHVLRPLGYVVRQMNGLPLPTEVARYHALMIPE